MNDAAPTARRPRAFRLDAAHVTGAGAPAPPRGGVIVETQADTHDTEPPHLPQDEAAIEAAQKKGMAKPALVSWGGLFWSALSGLVSLALGLWATQLIEGLFARSATLGWAGAALAGAALLALGVLATREIRAILRQKKIAVLHAALAEARLADDRVKAREKIGVLVTLYAERPETAQARARLRSHMGEIIDGRDLIDLAERDLIMPLDAAAQREIAQAAKRVSAVTAISPRALLDVLFVIAQAVRLLRRLSEIYGGRPGFLGFIRLARSVGAHIAITGGMAVGDSLVQQLVGHGIAARLSARLGEGVLNGLLTTRVGLSAMAVCRPMPFNVAQPPGVKDVAPFLFGGTKTQ